MCFARLEAKATHTHIHDVALSVEASGIPKYDLAISNNYSGYAGKQEGSVSSQGLHVYIMCAYMHTCIHAYTRTFANV